MGEKVVVPALSFVDLLSSGQTRLLSTTTEAESYLRLALSLDLFGSHHSHSSALSPFPRATTETYALDSFQNLLFSLARFREVTSRYPSQITVIGYEMKRQRFERLHRAAVKFPAQSFQYIGLEPLASEKESAKARDGEVSARPYKHIQLSDFLIVSSISILSFITVTNRTLSTCMVATTSFSLSDGQEIYSYAFTRITHPHQSCVGSWIGVPVTLGSYSVVPCRGKHQSESN